MLIVTRKKDAAQVRVICEALEGTVAKVVWTVTPKRLSNYKVTADGDYRITECGRFWHEHRRQKMLKCGHYVSSSDNAESRCLACATKRVRVIPHCGVDGDETASKHAWSKQVDGITTCAKCGMQRKAGSGYASQWRADSNSEWQRVYRRVRRQP